MKLRIIRRKHGISGNPHCFKIQAPLALMRTIAADPNNFTLSQYEQCAYTYAKLYYNGGGWWWFAGYSYDGDDTLRPVQRLIDNYMAHRCGTLTVKVNEGKLVSARTNGNVPDVWGQSMPSNPSRRVRDCLSTTSSRQGIST